MVGHNLPEQTDVLNFVFITSPPHSMTMKITIMTVTVSTATMTMITTKWQ
jgi:hypothetical protein